MTKYLRRTLFLAVCAWSAVVLAQTGVADGFGKLPEGAKVALMPMDVELFSISGGGMYEPQAEWTDNAIKNLKAAFAAEKQQLKVDFVEVADIPDETVDDLNRLHAAVGAAINFHYFGELKLPTKEGKLDWSLGEDVRVIREKTGADYALFTFMRDTYASSERVTTMIVAALFGVGLPGGFQAGYASLVDLKTGQVVWFSRLIRTSGDLRVPDKARETLEALLAKFPR